MNNVLRQALIDHAVRETMIYFVWVKRIPAAQILEGMTRPVFAGTFAHDVRLSYRASAEGWAKHLAD